MKQFLLKLPPYLPSVIVLMLLFYLTLVPQPLPPMEEPFLNFDKLVHVAMMAGVYLTFAFDYTLCNILVISNRCATWWIYRTCTGDRLYPSR